MNLKLLALLTLIGIFAAGCKSYNVVESEYEHVSVATPVAGTPGEYEHVLTAKPNPDEAGEFIHELIAKPVE